MVVPVVSTIHFESRDLRALIQDPIPTIDIAGRAVNHPDYSFIIFRDSIFGTCILMLGLPNEELDPIPDSFGPSVFEAMKLFHDHGYWYLRIDPDGEEVKELKTYDTSH